jgi:apolipoprotein N-acyltransferase
MKTQNYSNHSRLVAGWHGLTFFAILSFWIGSFVNLANAEGPALYSASLLSVAGFIFVCFFVFVRMFALKAQDRAIRAEENLRHFALTGKLLPSSLGIGQIVALRFAADEEFAAVAAKAAAENLTGKQIKQSINNWKADTYRV